jgi:hypothetical protein
LICVWQCTIKYISHTFVWDVLHMCPYLLHKNPNFSVLHSVMYWLWRLFSIVWGEKGVMMSWHANSLEELSWTPDRTLVQRANIHPSCVPERRNAVGWGQYQGHCPTTVPLTSFLAQGSFESLAGGSWHQTWNLNFWCSSVS